MRPPPHTLNIQGSKRIHLLSVDPGREKIGYVRTTGLGEILDQGILTTSEFLPTVATWHQHTPFTEIVLGNGTAHQVWRAALSPLAPVILVDETHSTLEARKRYWRTHPRRGWRALLPASFQTPPEPYDDLVAVILLHRHLKGCLTKNCIQTSNT